jgi:hypothetical protein
LSLRSKFRLTHNPLSRPNQIALPLTAPLLLLCLAADQLHTHPEPPHPDYSAFTQSYRIPFANSAPVDFDHLQSMSVRVSLNGGPPLKLQVDTGSCGVVIGADEVPDIDPHGAPGSITYTSSGIELIGTWTPVTLTFPDSKDEHGNVATAVVPVLAVTERKVHEGAVNGGGAKPAKNPQVHMLGIGSGRGKLPRQDLNPWVNLKEMQAGSMRRGYTITRDGVTLGLTAKTVGDGFLYEQLKPRDAAQTPKDWYGSLGWVTVGGRRLDTCTMLLDTGLTNMMIPAPEPSLTGDIADGTEITVHLLDGRLSYFFKVGDTANPAAPRKVTWIKRHPAPLVNTGIRALARFDYLYDADGGYIGLRPHTAKDSNIREH